MISLKFTQKILFNPSIFFSFPVLIIFKILVLVQSLILFFSQSLYVREKKEIHQYVIEKKEENHYLATFWWQKKSILALTNFIQQEKDLLRYFFTFILPEKIDLSQKRNYFTDLILCFWTTFGFLGVHFFFFMF
jgi:hypothetical protein